MQPVFIKMGGKAAHFEFNMPYEQWGRSGIESPDYSSWRYLKINVAMILAFVNPGITSDCSPS